MINLPKNQAKKSKEAIEHLFKGRDHKTGFFIGKNSQSFRPSIGSGKRRFLCDRFNNKHLIHWRILKVLNANSFLSPVCQRCDTGVWYNYEEDIELNRR